MEKESIITKARCRKTGIRYGMELKQFGSEWKVVDFIRLTDQEAASFSSAVKQKEFFTNDTLLPCSKCGNRKVSGCDCSKKMHRCTSGMDYRFDCIYCEDLEIDYSRGSAREGSEIGLDQNKKVKITFSNVEWKKFDNVQNHEGVGHYKCEPKIHVAANEENIEFHGYNISRMDEGVFYTIGTDDDFEIICDVDTSTIKPHPGGFLYISMGIITAKIALEGGSFLLDGQAVAKVGSRFNMALSVSEGGRYSITIDGKAVGEKVIRNRSNINIIFGFQHDSHHCEKLSHAYLRNIQMGLTRKGNQKPPAGSGSPDQDTPKRGLRSLFGGLKRSSAS